MTEDSDGPERGLNRLVSSQWRGEWGMEEREGGIGNDRCDRGGLYMIKSHVLVEVFWKISEVRHDLGILGVAPPLFCRLHRSQAWP